MKPLFILSDDAVTVISPTTGESVKIFSTDSQYEKAIELIKEDKAEKVFNLDVKSAITSFFAESNAYKFEIRDGLAYIFIHYLNKEFVLNNALCKRVMKMHEQGFDTTPLLNFITKLHLNPLQSAVDELYLFLEASELPLTSSGNFIAYKMVKHDYMDIYTGTMSNKVGEVVEMDRISVDADRNNTCSRGLHFCSRGYLTAYGSNKMDTDRCMLVEVDPADVVSIPVDYNNAKGRAWRYKVIGEVEGNWRETLPKQDFTDNAVYDHEDDSVSEEDDNKLLSSLDNTSGFICPSCYSENTQKRGMNNSRTKQRHSCNDCGKNYYTDI